MKNFSKPLNLSEIYDRVVPGHDSAVIATLALFILCYAFDEVLGLALGLNQYVIAAIAGATVVFTMVFVALRDLFVRRWNLFYLHHDEIVIAERKDQLVVITDTEMIRTGALRGCVRPILVNTRPWVNHQIECFGASVYVVLAANLIVDPTDPNKVRHWLQTEESDVTNEIKACVTQVIHRLGRGVVLESPDRFVVALEYDVNSRFLSSLGVTCRLSAIQIVDQHEFGIVKR
jgi:hypothetical protein